jgi:hypothetical protein
LSDVPAAPLATAWLRAHHPELAAVGAGSWSVRAAVGQLMQGGAFWLTAPPEPALDALRRARGGARAMGRAGQVVTTGISPPPRAWIARYADARCVSAWDTARGQVRVTGPWRDDPDPDPRETGHRFALWWQGRRVTDARLVWRVMDRTGPAWAAFVAAGGGKTDGRLSSRPCHEVAWWQPGLDDPAALLRAQASTGSPLRRGRGLLWVAADVDGLLDGVAWSVWSRQPALWWADGGPAQSLQKARREVVDQLRAWASCPGGEGAMLEVVTAWGVNSGNARALVRSVPSKVAACRRTP